MNILPKKSWHVLNKDNIARVRRDEAQARAEEEEKATRAAIAEQEARLGAMRKRARERDGVEEGEEEGEGGGWRERGRKEKKEECSVTDTTGHINFFTDLQKGIGLQVGNTEREKEMKQEQEKLEKRIGLLNYLVDKDKSDNVPWYVKRGRGEGTAEESRRSAKAQARKEAQDPLLEMKGFLETKRKREEMVGGAGAGTVGQGTSHGGQPQRQSSTRSTGDVQGPRDTASKEKHRDRHKSEHKKKKKKRKKEEKEEKKREREDELERLRRERRKREEAERMRSEALIRGLQGNVASEPQATEKVSGRYNSQFNPHLARQQ